MVSGDSHHYNIIVSIQYLILLYYHRNFESAILTVDEQDTLRQLWISIEKEKSFMDNRSKLMSKMFTQISCFWCNQRLETYLVDIQGLASQKRKRIAIHLGFDVNVIFYLLLFYE